MVLCEKTEWIYVKDRMVLCESQRGSGERQSGSLESLDEGLKARQINCSHTDANGLLVTL
uniref:Uncharacterized protein n=1 Tax=Anguilla anguilla TaxID=7936 RepID=A0A0E9SDL7_ANGAN